jgi:twitching motility protein PilT
MARIDSILSILVQQGANELRLGTDREPKMFAYGAQKKLSLPVTPDDLLRHLLGDILSPEREQTIRAKGRVEAAHDAGALGAFQVTITARDGNPALLDVVMLKGARSAATAQTPTPSAESHAHAPRRAIDDEIGALERAPIAPAPSAHVPASVDAEASSRREAAGESARAPAPSAVEPSQAALPEALVSLIARAAALRASDVHLLDGCAPSVRVDGDLRPLPEHVVPSVAALLAGTLDEAARARLASGRSADVAIAVEGVGRVRGNVYRASTGMAAALRILRRNAPSLASLHLPMSLDSLVDLPHGLVIVCGPTGSGKSTTLAALAQEALRRRSIMLLTLEDPIECELTPGARSLVRQRQIGRDVRDFATGLRDALREDPDVMLIGEMRDAESISLALTAAETGHLVLTSLHSRSAASAVERIIDVYAPERQAQVRVQLADALRAVVAQRLLPRARGEGRLPAMEVLRATHNVASLVREGRTAQIASAIQAGRHEGMLALERCLADMASNGQITVEDARTVANEPTSLSLYLAKRE